jgi:hypothetical protein
MQNARAADVGFPDLGLGRGTFEAKDGEVVLSELGVGVEDQGANVLDGACRGLPALVLRRRG